MKLSNFQFHLIWDRDLTELTAKVHPDRLRAMLRYHERFEGLLRAFGTINVPANLSE